MTKDSLYPCKMYLRFLSDQTTEKSYITATLYYLEYLYPIINKNKITTIIIIKYFNKKKL